MLLNLLEHRYVSHDRGTRSRDARIQRRQQVRHRVAWLRLLALLGFSNWPSALKTVFRPALAVTALAGISLHGITASNDQSAPIQTVVHQDLTVAMNLPQDATKPQEINGRLYRLTTLQASKASNLDISGEDASGRALFSRPMPLSGVADLIRKLSDDLEPVEAGGPAPAIAENVAGGREGRRQEISDLARRNASIPTRDRSARDGR